MGMIGVWRRQTRESLVISASRSGWRRNVKHVSLLRLLVWSVGWTAVPLPEMGCPGGKVGCGQSRQMGE